MHEPIRIGRRDKLLFYCVVILWLFTVATCCIQKYEKRIREFDNERFEKIIRTI